MAVMEYDLSVEVDKLRAEPAWRTRKSSKTLVKSEDMRLVLMALQSGANIPEHQTDGRLSVQVLFGHIQIQAGGRTFILRTGGLLVLDPGVPHDVSAIEETAFLLTIASRHTK